MSKCFYSSTPENAFLIISLTPPLPHDCFVWEKFLFSVKMHKSKLYNTNSSITFRVSGFITLTFILPLWFTSKITTAFSVEKALR